MSEQQFSIQQRSLTPTVASYIYRGPISSDGAIVLTDCLSHAFEYYLYDKVSIQFESPGGAYSALEVMASEFQRWQKLGKTISTSSQFECASAAAMLLTLGSWSHRTVNKVTSLLYHFARIGAANNLTAMQAGNMAHSIEHVDQRMIESLLKSQLQGAGGGAALVLAIQNRMQVLETHWDSIASEMSFRKSTASRVKPAWHKSLSAICTAGNVEKSISLYKRLLTKSFERDAQIDLRFAYGLCLIDSISDVVGHDGLLFTPDSVAQGVSPQTSQSQVERDGADVVRERNK